jgi:DNA-binding LytR/AlgR family response regulator
MPGTNGLDVARAVAAQGGLGVFTTAYDAHAVAAFEAGAIDYVLKPVRAERLAQSIARVRERLASREGRHALDAALDDLAARLAPRGPERIRWITAAIGDQVRMIALDDVVYFQAEEKYVRVATAADDALIRMPLKELLAGLDESAFWQVHRGTVVRVGAIDRVRKDELGKVWLSLKGRAERLAVSAAFQKRFRGM